jgi:hypothetical protein
MDEVNFVHPQKTHKGRRFVACTVAATCLSTAAVVRHYPGL